MSDLNMMPLYTDAYLADTTHLTIEEHGAYLKLLIVMWRNGGWLPNDDAVLARYLGVTAGKWKKLRPTLQQFFSYEGDRFTQKKLKEIFAAKMGLSEKNRANGIAGAEAKRLKKPDSHSANAPDSPAGSPEPESSEALANQKPDTRSQEEDKPSAVSDSRAAQTIAAFDDAMEATFLHRRAYPTALDRTFAERFLATGATVEWLKTLFLERLGRMKAQGKGPPNGLEYFEKAIPEAYAKFLAAKNSPISIPPAGGSEAQQLPKTTSLDQLQRKNEILQRFQSGGRA